MVSIIEGGIYCAGNNGMIFKGEKLYVAGKNYISLIDTHNYVIMKKIPFISPCYSTCLCVNNNNEIMVCLSRGKISLLNDIDDNLEDLSDTSFTDIFCTKCLGERLYISGNSGFLTIYEYYST